MGAKGALFRNFHIFTKLALFSDFHENSDFTQKVKKCIFAPQRAKAPFDLGFYNHFSHVGRLAFAVFAYFAF